MGVMQKIGGYFLILMFTFFNAALVGLCGSVLGLFFLIGPFAFIPLGSLLYIIADAESLLLAKWFPKTTLKFYLLGYVLPFVALIGIGVLVIALFPEWIEGLFGGSTPPSDPNTEYLPITSAALIFVIAVAACILTTLTALALNCRKCPHCKRIGINFLKLTDETVTGRREEFTGYSSERVATISIAGEDVGGVYQQTPNYEKFETRKKTYLCNFCGTEIQREKEFHISITRRIIDFIKKQIDDRRN